MPRYSPASTRSPMPLSVADPVFAADDPRLSGRTSREGVGVGSQAGTNRGGDEFLDLPRLELSGLEAERLLALAPSGETLAALGFDADRELLLSGALDGYRIVHLATHGLLDARFPELSGLVFSQLEESGRSRPGLVRAHEIYNLDLRSDLVVLSACETALGADVRGEGLVGLTQGFLSAGARTVLVSLWKVSDRSTAELMERFYVGLLRERLTPPRALRRAQLELAGSTPGVSLAAVDLQSCLPASAGVEPFGSHGRTGPPDEREVQQV